MQITFFFQPVKSVNNSFRMQRFILDFDCNYCRRLQQQRIYSALLSSKWHEGGLMSYPLSPSHWPKILVPPLPCGQLAWILRDLPMHTSNLPSRVHSTHTLLLNSNPPLVQMQHLHLIVASACSYFLNRKYWSVCRNGPSPPT